MQITMRRGTVDEGREIAGVINSVIAEEKYTIFDQPFSEEEERTFISSLGGRSALYVAEIDGKIAGVQVLDRFSTFANSTSHVATMGTWLRSEYRGCGVGRLLAEESFRFARSNGYRKIVIQVLADNKQALRFYRALWKRAECFCEALFQTPVQIIKKKLPKATDYRFA
jgi:ribosomal protein S18 acetylase RimI-like enzyme